MPEQSITPSDFSNWSSLSESEKAEKRQALEDIINVYNEKAETDCVDTMSRVGFVPNPG